MDAPGRPFGAHQRLSAEQSQERPESYGRQAVQTLGRAVQKGYGNAAELQQSPAFAPVRDRADFQQLLREVRRLSPD